MRILSILFLQISFVLLLSTRSFATTFIVSNLGDYTSGCLRYTVDNANASPGLDTIIFSSSGQIDLSIGDITITDPLFIRGDSIVVGGYPGYPIVSISNGGFSITSSASNTVIKALHFTNISSYYYRIPVYAASCDNLKVLDCSILTGYGSENFISDHIGQYGIQLQNCSNPVIQGNIIHASTALILDNCNGGLVKNNSFGTKRDGSYPFGTIPGSGIYSIAIQLRSASANITVDSNKIGFCALGIYLDATYGDTISNNIITLNVGTGIEINSGGSNNLIFKNTIANCSSYYGSGVAITFDSPSSVSNKISRNSLSCNQHGGIYLGQGNLLHPAPVFDTTHFLITGSSTIITGIAQPGDSVEIFIKRSCDVDYLGGDSLLAVVKADASTGAWTYIYPSTIGRQLTATATSSIDNNTSGFAAIATLVNCNENAIYAGANDTLCWPGPGAQLFVLNDATTTNTSNVLWSIKRNGIIQYPDNINTTYFTSATDTFTFGNRDTLIVTAPATGFCPAISDTTVVVFNPSPVAGAGIDQRVCATSPNVALTGNVYNLSPSVTWSTSGLGTFSPDANTLNATYIPDPADTTAGSVNLTLTPAAGTGVGSCTAIIDNVTIVFDHHNVADAGGDRLGICSNAPVATYLASITGGGSGHWLTSGTGKFMRGYPLMSDSTFRSDVYYYPSPLDTTQSTTLTLIADNGACPSTSSSMIVSNFTPVRIAIVGNDTVICETNKLQLNAKIYNATGGIWTTSGTGTFFPSDTTINAEYIPSQADLNSIAIDQGGGGKRIAANAKIAASKVVVTSPGPGGVTLTLTPTGGIAACSLTIGQLNLGFIKRPTFVVSNSIGDSTDKYIICQGDSLHLQGGLPSSVDTITGLKHIWQKNGTGIFYPSPDSLNVYYIPSEADKKKVAITLSLVVNVPGCAAANQAATSSVLGLVLPLPDVGIGTVNRICPDDQITLTAVSPGYGEFGKWSLVNKGNNATSGVVGDSSSHVTLISAITASENFYKWTLTDTTTGCVNSAEYIVYKCFEPDLNVFNAVTPNNDGMHDFFEIENIEAYDGNNVSIYNRWGDLVFEMDNYNNKIEEKRFIGKSNVKGENELPVGTYFYHIKKNNKIEKGTLVLRK